MAKIIDPDNLNQGVEVQFITGSINRIKLNVSGNLDARDGVTVQALYSFIKEEWRTDDNLIKFPFPMESITPEQFEFINGWDITGSLTDVSSSKNMLRDGGWALRDGDGNSREEYMNITTLGTFLDNDSDNAYYIQSASQDAPTTNTVFSGSVNQAIRIYASGSDYGAPTPIDYRDVFQIYLREQGKIYGIYDLLDEQSLSILTYRKFALPLANSTDLKISSSDAGIAANTTQTNISINYYTSSQLRDIGGTNYPFKVIIDANSNNTAESIYEYVQYQLRQPTNIDDLGTNVTQVIGSTTGELLEFVGDTLVTKFTAFTDDTNVKVSGGVFIDNFLSADTNRITFTDDSGSARNFPFVAAGTLVFNDNLTNDDTSVYRLFFTDADTYENAGSDFGTGDAIIINDNSSQPITGSVDGSGSIGFDYDYDNNIQRGNSSSGSDVPFTAVALGLSTAKYVVTTGTITRSTANTINFVSALERNYSNPS